MSIPPCRPHAYRKRPIGSPTSCAPCRRVSSTASSIASAIRIDPAKRIDVPSQVARALVSLPELRDSVAPESGVRGAHAPRRRGARLAPRRRPCRLDSSRCSRAGSCSPARSGTGVELILPGGVPRAAQVVGGRGPARHARAPLAGAVRDDERDRLALPRPPGHAAARALARVGVGRPRQPAEARPRRSRSSRPPSGASSRASRPRAARSTPRSCSSSSASRCACAPPPARRPSRRGVGFSLERRALLIPVHPNRHVVPDRGERDHRRRAPHRARRAARRGEALRRVGRSRAAPRALLARSLAARDERRHRRARVLGAQPRGAHAVGRVRRRPRRRRARRSRSCRSSPRASVASRRTSRSSSRSRAPSGSGSRRR